MDTCTTVARTASQRESIAHLLNRAAYGPTAELAEHVQCVGPTDWIEEQLHPDSIDDADLAARLAAYPSVAMSTAELLVRYPARKIGMMPDPTTAPGRILDDQNAALVTRAVHGRAQLEAVLTDFWLNHFNVLAPKGPTKWTIASYVRDTIRPHVLGRFEDLLRATAKSPAMLYYLDNYLNATDGDGGGINENYGRELMELHTLGVDGGYTQDDVREVSRAFTGWSITPDESGAIDFVYHPTWHDTDPKTVLGVPIPRGQIAEGYRVLHLLAHHPSTANFIATELVRRLVSDDPPAALVSAARTAFIRTAGDLREVVRVILTADIFSDPRYYGAKAKSPLHFVASALRAVGADVKQGFAAAGLVAAIGQPLLQAVPPTGWSDRVEDVVSVGGMLSRFSAAQQLASNAVEGVDIDTHQWDYLKRGWRAVNRLLVAILQRPGTAATRHALERLVNEGAEPATVVALALSSPEFQQC